MYFERLARRCEATRVHVTFVVVVVVLNMTKSLLRSHLDTLYNIVVISDRIDSMYSNNRSTHMLDMYSGATATNGREFYFIYIHEKSI